MPAIILPDRWLRQPSGSISLRTSLPFAAPNKVVVGHSVPGGAVIGSNVGRGATQDGATLRQTQTYDDTFLNSSYTVTLGTRPSSGTFLVVGSRAGTISTVGIAYAFNTRYNNESNYTGISFGNRWAGAGAKNKVYADAVGTSVNSSLHIAGKKQSSAAVSDREYASGETIVAAASFSSVAGTSYELLGKSGTGGCYSFPTDIALFVEFPLLPDVVSQELSRAPWQIFAKKRIYFLPSAGGGGATGSFAVQEPGPDTASFTGDVIVQGSFSPQEGGVDSASFAGLVKVQGSFAVQEPPVDTSLFEGQVVTPGSVTLSAATVLNLTRTTATPRVTVTFS